MATNTEHYNLIKPGQDDFYNVDDFNGNADILDSALQGKVDKVSGKGLSTNDYTTAEKTKVASVDNKVDKIPGKGLSTNDYDAAEKAKVAAAVPNTRKVNGKALSADINLNAGDVGADVAGAAAAVQTNLNSHTANKSNPHGVTRTQIDAAAAVHTHVPDDLFGVLPVGKGGTGASSFGSSRILLGNGSNPFYQVNYPSGNEKCFLTQSTTATPTWMTPAGAANLIFGGTDSGTWTPKITNGRNGATITYVAGGENTYYRIGKILVCTYNTYINTIPSGATDLMYVSGLPGTPIAGHAPAGLYWYRLGISIVSLNITIEPTGFFFWRTTAAADTNGNPLTSNNLTPGGSAAGTLLKGTFFARIS